jgi:hypothetical protein
MLLLELWLTDAEANIGNVIAETAAAEMRMFRIERVVRSVFMFFTLI